MSSGALMVMDDVSPLTVEGLVNHEIHERVHHYHEAYEEHRCICNAADAALAELTLSLSDALTRMMNFEAVTRSAISMEEGRGWCGVKDAANWHAPDAADGAPPSADAGNDASEGEAPTPDPLSPADGDAATIEEPGAGAVAASIGGPDAMDGAAAAPTTAPATDEPTPSALPADEPTTAPAFNEPTTITPATEEPTTTAVPADEPTTTATQQDGTTIVAAAAATTATVAAVPSPTLPPQDAVPAVPSWMELAFEMVDQMERMVRCMTQQDEADAATALLTGFHSMLALQRLHDGVVVVLEGEVQDRYVVAAAEEFARWGIEEQLEAAAAAGHAVAQPEGHVVNEAEDTMVGHPTTLPQELQSLQSGDECEDPPLFVHTPQPILADGVEAQSQGAARSSAPAVAPATEDIAPTPEDARVEADQEESGQHQRSESAAEHTVEAVGAEFESEGVATLPDEISAILDRFISDDRVAVADEELEARDVLSIEMELDRDETMAAVRDRLVAGHRPAGADGEVDDTEDVPSTSSADHSDNITRAAQTAAMLQLQVTSAEQYERQTIAVRRGAFVRLVEELTRTVSSPTDVDGGVDGVTFGHLAMLQHRLQGIWQDVDAPPRFSAVAASPVGAVPKRRPPGMLLPVELRLHPKDDRLEMHAAGAASQMASPETPDTVARPVANRADEHEDGRPIAPDAEHDTTSRGGLTVDDCLTYSPDGVDAATNEPRKSNAVVVPDAAQLGRLGSPSKEDDEVPNETTDEERGETDEQIEEAFYEVRARQRFRDFEARRQDMENDESVEREFVFLAADEERRAFVHLFASCIVEEYDWSIGAFRTRMRCLPALQPRAPRQASNRATVPYTPSPAERALSSTMKAKDRHLPQYMRTPVPPRQPASPQQYGMRSHSGLFMPAPPSSLSRMSQKGGDPRSVSRTTLSRLTDLIPLTGLPAAPLTTQQRPQQLETAATTGSRLSYR